MTRIDELDIEGMVRAQEAQNEPRRRFEAAAGPILGAWLKRVSERTSLLTEAIQRSYLADHPRERAVYVKYVLENMASTLDDEHRQRKAYRDWLMRCSNPFVWKIDSQGLPEPMPLADIVDAKPPISHEDKFPPGMRVELSGITNPRRGTVTWMMRRTDNGHDAVIKGACGRYVIWDGDNEESLYHIDDLRQVGP